MIVHRFLTWVRNAPAEARASATAALAGAYLAGQLDEDERFDAVAAMMLALDDEEPAIRLALARALADHPDAPRTVIVGLAADRGEIAAVVLERSPVVNEAELIHHTVVGDLAAQTAIACRRCLGAPAAAALAEVGELQAVLALARNKTAALPHFAMRRMIQRFGDHSGLREALIERVDLTLATRQALLAACAKGADPGGVAGGAQAALAEDTAERATVALAAGADPHELAGLSRHLRDSGQLTSRLILRAMLVGQMDFACALLAELSGLSSTRVAPLLRDARGAGFTALYRKARLPLRFFSVFVTTIESRREILREEPGLDGARLARLMVTRVIERCRELGQPGLESLQVMLRQLETEAAREDARASERALAIYGWSRELSVKALGGNSLVGADDVMDLAEPFDEPTRMAAA